MPKENYRRIIKGYEPKMQEGIKEVYDWIVENRDKIEKSARF
jgi:UDP-N-acetyl-D-mannosaminuronate dehydrogenase